MFSTHTRPAELIYTWHATERMRTLQISRAEVSSVVNQPDFTWPGDHTRQGPTTHYTGKHILVLLGSDGCTVITVKLRTDTPYLHGIHTRTAPPTPSSRAA